MMKKESDIVIGIEVHIQLNTKSKLFSRCSNSESDIPNSHIDFYSSGQIGWYPVINTECVKKAVVFGLAINGNIKKESKFSRKCYFYKDNPKNYQITQEKHPIIQGGHVKILKNKKTEVIKIDRVQLEEDTANIKLCGNLQALNLNRAGSPLIEVITTPSIYSIEDAVKFCKEIRNLAIENNISTGALETGAIRFDCNISVKDKSGKLGTRYEIKNLNSFNNIEKALRQSLARQRVLIFENTKIKQSTFKWDQELKDIVSLRDKDSNFYGFMPEVDVPNILINQEYINKCKSMVSEHPCERTLSFMEKMNIDEDEARTASEDPLLANYIDSLVKLGIVNKDAFSWTCVESKGIYSKYNMLEFDIYNNVHPKELAEIILNVSSAKISRSSGKKILENLINGKSTSYKDYISKNQDILAMEDADLSSLVLAILKKNEFMIQEIESGNFRLLDFLIGQCMKESKGKGNPYKIKEILLSNINI